MVKINWVRVETALAERNMLPEELARRIGVRVNVLKRYLNTGFASYSAAVKIADILGLRLFDVIIRR
ncbi:MAG: helix-turn-helix transcriptional regulator [Selenomonadaceae bacterium]|nr:helix-turn-helix transcriptional regulator [Selenomonadaceae bacterium]MBR0060481.1 helix-turn-helix transcriptional regulator [Selenomonadaceae bacterium]